MAAKKWQRRLGVSSAAALLALAISSWMIGVADTGFASPVTVDPVFVAVGIVLGFASVLTGAGMWLKGDTYSYALLCVTGLFWLSLSTLIILDHTLLGATGSDSASRAFFYLLWAIVNASFLQRAWEQGGATLLAIILASTVTLILSAVYREVSGTGL
jgi:succinate-acetate transporter protein